MKHSTFTVPATPNRRHRALFDSELPFRGRKEKSRVRYQRRDKHRGRHSEMAS